MPGTKKNNDSKGNQGPFGDWGDAIVVMHPYGTGRSSAGHYERARHLLRHGGIVDLEEPYPAPSQAEGSE